MKISAITPRTNPNNKKNYAPNFKSVYYYDFSRFTHEVYLARDKDKEIVSNDYLMSKFRVNIKETADKMPDIAVILTSDAFRNLNICFETEEDYNKRGWLSKRPQLSDIPIKFKVDPYDVTYALSADYFMYEVPRELERACSKVREVELARKKCEQEHPNLNRKAINQMLVADYAPYCTETNKRISKAFKDFDHECYVQLHKDEKPVSDNTWATMLGP